MKNLEELLMKEVNRSRAIVDVITKSLEQLYEHPGTTSAHRAIILDTSTKLLVLLED